MSQGSEDPFEKLAKMPIPRPDAAAKQATLAAVRRQAEAKARQAEARPAVPPTRSWYVVPLAASIAAVIAGLAGFLMASVWLDRDSGPGDREMIADEPGLNEPEQRFGAWPGPEPEGPSLGRARPPLAIPFYQDGPVRIGYQFDGQLLQLYVETHASAPWASLPGRISIGDRSVQVVAATRARLEGGESDAIAVQLRWHPGDDLEWKVYRIRRGITAAAPDLEQMLGGVTDKEDARRLLEGAAAELPQ